MLFLAAIPAKGAGMFSNTANTAEFPKNGPRSDEVHAYFYDTSDDAWSALVAGEVDITTWPLTIDQFEEAILDPNIIVVSNSLLDMVVFDFNNNLTIPTYPDVLSPMSNVNFRRALAYLIDKDYIVDTICGGLAQRIDVPIPYPLSSWWNTSVTGSNYPYPYDPERAALTLDESGFDDHDGDGVRNYPYDWPGRETGPNLDPIIFYFRIDDTWRMKAALHLADNMEALGIPVDLRPCSYLPYEVWNHDYHIYTNKWERLRRYPTYLYNLYHSESWISFVDSPEPDSDDYYWEKLLTATSLDEAMEACKKGQGELVHNCVSVWLWSTVSYFAYRNNLVGIVNMEGYGPINRYTLMNAYKTDNTPIKVASKYYFDVETPDSLVVPNPYDLTVDQPWIAQDWGVTEWYDNETDEVKTLLTVWLRPDTFYDAWDVEATIWYHQGWNRELDLIHHVEVPDAYTINIYYDAKTIWALHLIGELSLLRTPDIFYDKFGVYTVSDHMYYPSEYAPGSHLILKANRYYFLETPPLGEIDWRWYWEGTTKPRNGYFTINIYDVVQAARAYGSNGLAVPSPYWFPGADITSPGHIDIYDIVVICVNYGIKFGPIALPQDADGDGIPNAKDIDDDNDGVPDYQDVAPLNPNRSRDTDGDGIDDTQDNDIDGDGIPNNNDTDDDGDGNSDEFESRMRSLRQKAYLICNPTIDAALRAQEKMNKKGDAMDDGGELGVENGNLILGLTDAFGPNTGETRIDTEDNSQPGAQDGFFWNPVDVDGDNDADDCDVIRVIVHEARHAWQMQLRGRSEVELGKDIDGDRILENDVRQNDRDADGLPDRAPQAPGIQDPNLGNEDNFEQIVRPRLEQDAEQVEGLVPVNPWWPGQDP